MRPAAPLLLSCLLLASAAWAAPPQASTPPAHDPALAERLGADERGMRSYVLVILKTGPTRVPDGPARDAMFAGHFANMERLSAAGQLVLAGYAMAKKGLDSFKEMNLKPERTTQTLQEDKRWIKEEVKDMR